MEWDHYKRLCDRPDVVSRWMLEQTLELVAGHNVAAALRDAIGSVPLTKPTDHHGGEATNMYMLNLAPAQRGDIVRLVRAARDAGIATSNTTQRGLGGFVEAWQEYQDWDDARPL
ncbi:MAG: hypothetical protein O7B25_14700 [Gammaproteobacteria bacterium]|nr:hypothetical protein [Gammaproteobacteria bacterium]